MNELLQTILTYISIWLPSLVSSAGTAITLLFSLNKFNSGVCSIKNDSEIRELKAQLSATNKKLDAAIKQNDILIDRITQINGYRRNKR